LRALEKQAVVFGGGANHRFGLFDQVLVKDNHLFLAQATGSREKIAALTRQIRAQVGPSIFVQVEATTQDEALAAATNGADSILFDNFAPANLHKAVAAVRAATTGKKLVLEASGGINLTTVRVFAETGVDRISVGALTHSVKSLDITMDIEPI
jgi:nicotinate-nucleotide pyrophosphorylase (carboxylating)